jgi:hypothetical protein
MIAINVEDSRFTVKLGFIEGPGFNTVIDEFRKIEKRQFVKETKTWSFPNEALRGLCKWFDSNGMKYTLKDKNATVKVFSYAGKLALEVSPNALDYGKLSKVATEVVKGELCDTIFVDAEHVSEVMNWVIESGEYKYELIYCAPSISPSHSPKNEKRSNSEPDKIEPAKPRKSARR